MTQKAFYEKRKAIFLSMRIRDDDELFGHSWIEPARKWAVEEMRKDAEQNFDVDTQYKVANKLKWLYRNEKLEEEQKQQRIKNQFNARATEILSFIVNQENKTLQETQEAIDARVKEHCKTY